MKKTLHTASKAMLILALSVTSFAATVQNDFPHVQVIGSDLHLSWKIDGDNIAFELRHPTKGYVAIGFSPNGGMRGSDIIMAWVGPDGVPHVKDMHATHNGEPIEDKSQDVILLSGSEDEKGSTISFMRKMDTCDDDDYKLNDDTVRVIWAWSDEDPEFTEGKWSFKYHGTSVKKRGTQSLYFTMAARRYIYPDQEETYPENVFHFDFKIHNFSVPKTETKYACRIIKLPQQDVMKHVISYRTMINEESFPHIHHINVAKCRIPAALNLNEKDVFEKYLDLPSYDCYTDDTPSELIDFCFDLDFAAGVGSQGDIYPENLGKPFGSTEKDTYFRLEIHYENPEGRALIDSSAMRVYYTPKLRKYEVGMLFLGHRRSPFLSIPPRQSSFKIMGFCSSECTSKGISPEGIKIIAVLLHSHLTGRKMRLRHVRDGKELPIIAEDSNYDFNYQHFRMLKDEVKVLPGDELITECDFETSENSTFVFGGLSTRREMCESFVLYYPKTTLMDCRSQPELYSYWKPLGINDGEGPLLVKLKLPFTPNRLKNQYLFHPDDSLILEKGFLNEVNADVFKDVYITDPKIADNKIYNQDKYMTEFDWTDKKFSKFVETSWINGRHYMHCADGLGRRIPIDGFNTKAPQFQSAPPAKDPVCLKGHQLASSGTQYKLQAPASAFIILLSSILLQM